MSESASESGDLHPIVRDLIARRLSLGLSQRAVGRTLGTSSATMCVWERGDNLPTLGHLCAWARALGYEITLTPDPAGLLPVARAIESEPQGPAAAPAKSSGDVVDLLGALQRSVDAAKAARSPSAPRGLHDCISCGEPLDGDDPNEVCDECCPCGCPICVHETTGCRACWPECRIPHADAVAASEARVATSSEQPTTDGEGIGDALMRRALSTWGQDGAPA